MTFSTTSSLQARDTAAIEKRAEHQRLKDAVVEAAKDVWEFGTDLYDAKLTTAVETLLEFEKPEVKL